ncbi:MAG: hypothetical protein IID61_10785 [SAR324 cluster bacterium]|nr:hypothetical protein [SAR324 cluster bacterium]
MKIKAYGGQCKCTVKYQVPNGGPQPDAPFRRGVKITSGKDVAHHGNGSIRLPFAMIAHVTHHGAMADGRIRLSGRAVGGGLDTGARLSAGGNAIINVMLRRQSR